MTARNSGLIGVAVVCAGLAIASRSHFDGLAVGALWVRLLGLAVLVTSTVFTLWARLSIGIMWSVMPRLQGDHQLRTHGPYAVTRHPIYTGGLGMLLGITLIVGIGQLVVLFPACLIVLEVKIRMEEHLLVAAFPDEYPRAQACPRSLRTATAHSSESCSAPVILLGAEPLRVDAGSRLAKPSRSDARKAA